MKQTIQSNRFKRDFKKMLKRGASQVNLQKVLVKLAMAEPLPDRCRPHKLVGEYMGLWECHIEPDWLLIYDVREGSIGLARTGTHSDLFK